ncbi:MAG TPA: hypothetical protein VI168_09155 [Croceibacterium sp.]
MGMFDHLKPSNYGAESAADVGVFAVGAAIGGIGDAIANFAGFADPLVLAGLGGAGALGLKKLLWDTPREAIRSRRTPSPIDATLAEITFEIEMLDERASVAERKRWQRFLAIAHRRQLDPIALRRLWEQYR